MEIVPTCWQLGLGQEEGNYCVLGPSQVKIIKFQGEFVWHKLEDELFLVWRDHFRVERRDRTVELGAGEFLIVARGVEHRTVAEE